MRKYPKSGQQAKSKSFYHIDAASVHILARFCLIFSSVCFFPYIYSFMFFLFVFLTYSYIISVSLTHLNFFIKNVFNGCSYGRDVP